MKHQNKGWKLTQSQMFLVFFQELLSKWVKLIEEMPAKSIHFFNHKLKDLSIFENQKNYEKSIFLSLIITLLIHHSTYWLTAWFSPWIFIAITVTGIYLSIKSKDLLWVIRSLTNKVNSEKDAFTYKCAVIGTPFLVINQIAFFACLFMISKGVMETKENVMIKGAFDHFYFSSTTLTTLGYGDMIPVTKFAKAIAIFESLIGFGVLAILIGIISSGIVRKLE